MGEPWTAPVSAQPALDLPEAEFATDFIRARPGGSGASPIELLPADPHHPLDLSQPRPGSLLPVSLEWPDHFADHADELRAARANPDSELTSVIAEVQDCRFGTLVLRVAHHLQGPTDVDLESVHCSPESDELFAVRPGGSVPYGTWQKGGLVLLTSHHGELGGTAYPRWYGMQPSDVALLTQP